MVTNTAGTATTDTSNAKENGECEKDNAVTDEYSRLKQNSSESSKVAQVEKVVGSQQNDATDNMSNLQNETNEGTNYSQAPGSNGLPGNGTYNARAYGNGAPPPTSMPMNGPPGPPQGQPNASYQHYGSYNHNSTVFTAKPGVRPMQAGQNYPPSMQQRYPNQQSGSTPTLNQLLTTPARYHGQYPGYNSHPSSQQQADYGQAHPQSWQARPQQYVRGPPDQQAMKPEMGGYPQQQQQQQQYPPPQHPGYPPNQGRFPAPSPTSSQAQYNQSQQYNTSMPPPGSSGYPPASTPSRHPGYSGYPNYNHMQQQSPYYGQRPAQPHGYSPTSYPGPSAGQPQVADGKGYSAQEQQPTLPPQMSDLHGSEHIMSPNRRTPQPGSHPGSVQSPMNATTPSPHLHHGHPAVAQLRGASPAPGSPASTGQPRATPLSPPSVRPSTPQQQAPMRSASEHSDPSIPGQSYAHYRHTSQQSYGSQPPNYQQHMMSPQQQPMYPTNQQHPTTPQHQGTPPMRPSGPPSGGKPAHQIHNAQPNFNQSQQSPAYQQPGSHMHYYDNVPQHHHVMQGYNASSPAPSERRPSRQGSHPSTAPPPQTEQQGRQGAAAAAAAAMAAAAHSAQPGNAPSQKPQTPGYYQQQPQQQQQQRPQHPNFSNMQPGGEMYQQNTSYQRMPHPGAPTSGPSQRMMAPHGLGSPPNQGMHRMHPPSAHYPAGYPQPGQPPQGHYPGYYPQGGGDPNHPQGPHPGYPPANSYEQSSVPEEQTKKQVARSASQKLAALYEPADEPGRREFIESVLRYWEDKDLPLKNAPLMGRKTLDLFRLYQMVKERGGMQEVTSGKKWTDISTRMNLGTASTSGFTLKKQYCKYLYGFECKMERGEPEPQEALARITEANRKRKQASDQQAQKDEAKLSAQTPQPPPHNPQTMPPQHPESMPSSQPHYPSQQYPMGQYSNQMGPQYRPPQPAYSQHQNPAPHHMASYLQHPGQSGMGPRPGAPPVPGYPSMQESVSSYGPQPQSTPNTSYPAQTPPSQPQSTPAPVAPPESQNADAAANPPEAQQQPPATPTTEANLYQTPDNDATKQSIKPPVPMDTSLAAANPFSESKAAQHHQQPSAPPTASPSYHPSSHPGTPHQQYPPPPTHEQYRPGSYPPRPGMPPTHYPYSNSPHARLSGSSHPGMMLGTHPSQAASPRTSLAYPASSRPTYPQRPGQYPMQPSSYGSSVNSPYPGMKRPSSDVYGPPSKYIRPDGHPSHYSSPGGYPPNRHQHESPNPPYHADNSAMMRHRYHPNAAPPPNTRVTYSAPVLNPSIKGPTQSRPHPSYPQGYPPQMRRPGPMPISLRRLDGTQDRRTRPAVRWGNPAMVQRTQSPVPFSQMHKYVVDPRQSSKRQFHMPRSPYQVKRDNIFPPDSVEASQPHYSKFQRKSCHDVGVIEGWRIVMSLKSGLLVESTWALNVLTILLYDQQTVAQLKLTQLPGLLDALVEHYRRCLSELFTLQSEHDALGVPSFTKWLDESHDSEVFENDELSLPSKPKLRSRKKKGYSTNSKLISKFTNFPVKIEHRNDSFLQDAPEQWESCKSLNIADDLSHIVLSFSQESKFAKKMIKEEPVRDDNDSIMVVEATLEDVLSIPCSVLSPDDYDITKNHVEALDVKIEKIKVSRPENEKVEDEGLTNKSSSMPDNAPDTEEPREQANCKAEKNSVEEEVSPSTESTKTTNDTNTSANKVSDNSKNSVIHSKEDTLSCTESTTSIITTKLADVTNKSNDVTNSSKEEETIKAETKDAIKEDKEKSGINGEIINKATKDLVKLNQIHLHNAISESTDIAPMCNGLPNDVDTECNKHTEAQDSDDKTFNEASAVAKTDQTSSVAEVKSEHEETEEKEIVDGSESTTPPDDAKSEDAEETIKLIKEISVTLKVEKVLEERNVILLEDEATGSDGSLSDILSGPLLCSKFCTRRNELSTRLQCISNILRGLSFIPCNINELCRQRNLMRALSGTLLLRHKHRTRTRQNHIIHNNKHGIPDSLGEPKSMKEEIQIPEADFKVKLEGHKHNNKCRFPLKDDIPQKINCVNTSKYHLKSSDYSAKKKRSSDLFAPDTSTTTNPIPRRKRCLFSATVLDGDDNEDVYSDPWWWDCVRRVREDSLVILANISPSVDLSILPDDYVPLAVLEACLHWSVCPSSDACDSFSSRPRHIISAQRLALEILTKLSIKDQNVDLILATRPFSRIEKLFGYLVNLICDRKDQTLREFAIVLLSNLSRGESTAARAIALQGGSISGLIAFLEECEETGVSNRQMFRQQSINCGTTVFMMAKAAKTLLSMASVPENKPSFIKHQLRLLSLSMSQLLGGHVTSIVSSVLYELTHDTT